MVDVDYVVAYIERCEVVEGKLLGLFNRTADRDAVEAVENFMVCIVADLFLLVDEAVMDVLSCNEVWQGTALLFEDGAEPVGLSLLFAVDVNLVAGFDFCSDIGCKEFEVFVENRLGRDAELNCVYLFSVDRYFEKDSFVAGGKAEEFPVLVHI